VVKKKATNKSAAIRNPITLLQKLFIISLFLINLFLIYLLILKLVPFSSVSQNNNQTDLLKEKIQVEVLNGCGVSGIADKLTDYLREKSFDVVNIGNYRSFEIDNSILIDRTGNLLNVKIIADSIGLNNSNIIQQINKDYLLDVTIILGKDYSKLIPLKKRS
jgi:regulatory protein YycI of two-component signal transduction system YycFG